MECLEHIVDVEMVVEVHHLEATAAAAAASKTVCSGVEVVAAAAKDAPPNSRAFRIRRLNQLFYDCIRS